MAAGTDSGVGMKDVMHMVRLRTPSDAAAITLEYKLDNPTQPGWYLVLRRGVSTPQALWWSGTNEYWLSGAQRIDVCAWVGPIVMPREEL